MKKLFLFLALASVSLSAQTLSNKYQHIGNTWNAPNSTYPACSATVTSSCLRDYTFTAKDPTGKVNSVTVGLTNTNGVVSYSWGPGGYLYVGSWQTSVVANYLDDTGAVVSTAPLASGVTVPAPFVASPPSGFTSTLQP